MERVISSPSRPKDPLVRCQFSSGKYPHFSGLACISNPFSLPTLWLSKPLSLQSSLHNTTCANTTSEPPEGVFWLSSWWLCAEPWRKQLRSDFLGSDCYAQHYQGTLSSALKGKIVFWVETLKSWYPAPNPQALWWLTIQGHSWWTRWRGTHAGVWFHL